LRVRREKKVSMETDLSRYSSLATEKYELFMKSEFSIPLAMSGRRGLGVCLIFVNVRWPTQTNSTYRLRHGCAVR
jgi:hypothetical protein